MKIKNEYEFFWNIGLSHFVLKLIGKKPKIFFELHDIHVNEEYGGGLKGPGGMANGVG